MSRVIFVLLMWAALFPAAHAEAPWLLVDTTARTLGVWQDGALKQEFSEIATGRGGVGYKREMGDGKTPIGEFRIKWVNPQSKFYLFFGLDYPDQQHAEAAWRDKRIDFDTYYAIRAALYRGEVPPQDTPIGGSIGIHGIGNGDLNVHRRFNWTKGCIALTNEQIVQLARWIQIGTRVVIR